MFKAVQLAAKGPAIILNQKYIWGMFNMNFVAFNFSIEENIFIYKKTLVFLLLEREGASTRTLNSAA